MNEDNHDRTIRQRLDEELESLHFTQTQKVLQRTHPTTWRE
ncbi:MAG: hypothetical protein K0R67_2537, partial [Paenibacillus sp.]|nr:hypothetical protein [Paenibacillus sp.]